MSVVGQSIWNAERMRPLRLVFTVALGVAVMVAAAKTQVPFWPVPMTLHTLAVMGFAVAMGPRMATGIFLAYLAAGAVGLPVFSGSPDRGVGIAYMAGPTGGYLVGYLIASWLVGVMARGKGIGGQVVAMLTGMVPIYSAGMAWLAIYVPADQLIAVGIAPFVLGDLVKIGMVAVGGLAISSFSARVWEKNQ